jgi:ATP-binding cassette subfamily B protein RaxB
VRAIQTIKLFQKESERLSQWLNRLSAALEKDLKLASWFVRYDALNAILFGVENLLVIYFAVGAVNAGQMTLGMLYAFIAYKLAFMNSMNALVQFWVDYRMLDVHLERLKDIVHTPTERRFTAEHSGSSSAHDALLRLEGSVEVRNLGFRYSQQEPFVFRHLSFSIVAGEAVAITGPSGCGKTTLLKCMLGLLEPVEGQIFVDGEDIHKLPRYREQIAAVMQDDQLLNGSIADNIGCFEPKVDLNRVRRCARLAGIETEILAMPMQFNTLVGDLGSTLSGGQKQRVLLARALYRSPRILFMDEATSHLDVAMESHVNGNVAALHITRILVAHRTETVRSAGRKIELAVYEAAGESQ